MASTKLDDVAGRVFDYVVIGGGTAGLTLAARLSEDISTTVCVLEAGSPNIDDPVLLTPGPYGKHFGQKTYDWGHASNQQKLIGDRIVPISSGFGLGGSSAINFTVWTKPPAEEVDDWERLGNPGWNWKNYQKYMAKVERFVEPSSELREKFKIPRNDCDLSTEGALVLSYPKSISDAEPFMIEALNNAGVPAAPRPYGGDPVGYCCTPATVDPATATRSYATTAYYLPHKDRQNLIVFTDAHVNRIISVKDSQGNLTATGVEFSHEASTFVVHVSKEVIVSAGALKSPQVLELSGIGRRDVLQKAGVDVKVELPGVGENMQEHIFGYFSWLLKPEYDGFLCFERLKHPNTLAKHLELYKSLSGAFTMGFNNFTFVPLSLIAPHRAREIYQKAKTQIEMLDPTTTPPGLMEQYKIQLERLEPGKNQTGPGCEIIGVAGIPGAGDSEEGRAYLSWAFANNHTFSRGAVHVVSNSPRDKAEIDPHYFEHAVDLDIFMETAKFARNLCAIEPLKDMIEKEIIPGPEVETDEQLCELVKQTYSTIWHTCGTCSMLPREKGGVVDPTLKVYGTNNVRVVDLSVVPLHFASHPQSTVYAIAEQAADIIKGVFIP